MDTKEQLFTALTALSNELFSDRDHFVCVYGSYASGHYTTKSDIDLFIAAEHHGQDEFERARDTVRELHRAFGLPLDDEVPYENKLIVSYDDVRGAIALHPFINEDGYAVPPVEKSEEFLSSRAIRLRLILNALTTPHVCISGNVQLFDSFKGEAEQALVVLAHGLLKKTPASHSELVMVLIQGTEGENGEMYLGYKKERPAVVRHLEDLITRNLAHGI